MKSLSPQSLFKIILTVCFSLLSFLSYSQYCNSFGTTTFNDGITYVSFNTISNADVVKNNGYEDFTSISTDVYKGSTYNLIINVNTDGNWRNYAIVWIDWNGDGDFADSGEEYDMGSVKNVVDNPTSNSPTAISVPLTAVVGPTRMRVSTRYNNYPTSSCATNFDGEVEDYTIVIKEGSHVYCTSSGNTDFNDGITYVSFNSISNATSIIKNNGYEDFTNISTNVYKGSIHDLLVRVNTDGNWRNYAIVWIDWNRDGDFTDSGEEYDMGSVRNVTDGLTSNSPTSILVPLTAVVGTTRMRVSTKYNSYPSSSCDTGFDGEVEDYTINIMDNFINFNGSNDYIDFADNHDLTGPFSLEAWVNQESSVATGTVISKGNIDTSDKTGYHFSLKNNYPNLIWYGGSNNELVNITSLYAIPDNQWHHIAATFDGTTVRLYVDGIEVNSAPAASPPTNTANSFIIGADTANYATTPLNYNFFNGAIQEVRVWDVALSESQIREMMNQHIEDNTNVRGSETKINISGGLMWSNLLGYYPLDANTADDSSSYGIDGIPQNMSSSQIVTAPLPYKTNGDSAWDTGSTWLNFIDMYLPNTVGIDGVTPIDWNIIHLTNNVSSGNRDIKVSALISESGTLTMEGTTNMSTGEGTGHSLTITNYLELDGIIDLQGESQLIQTEGSILDADSGGYIERDQQGTANGFNYNYWSSSVGPIGNNNTTRGTGTPKTNASYTILGVMKDGTQDINFDTSPYAADSSTPTNPITISSYWLYTFYGLSGDYNSWTKIDQNVSLLPGEGFTMKGSSGSTSLASKQNYIFKGLPNNGDITLPLVKISGTDDVDRLIGNPYPSAINVAQFILDNISTTVGGNNINGTIFNGAVYFWDHFGEQNTHNLKGYVGGYATRNITAGAPAVSNDSRINNNGASSTKVPGPYIAVNQGFFVSLTPDLPITVDGGDIVFNNGQRVFVTEDGSKSLVPEDANSLFFKSSNNKKSDVASKSVTDKHIIRLQYDSPLGYHRQIVIGAIDKASNKFDMGYDAYMADVNEEDMYWMLDDAKFVIQGVNNFDDTQEFPLGLIVKKTGMARINLFGLENVDGNKPIYIKDTSLDKTYQINETPFEIYLEAGTYNDRFKLVFQPIQSKTLSVNESDLDRDVSMYYSSESSNLNISLKADMSVSKGLIFNLLGQKITDIKGFLKSVSVPLKVSTGTYIVQLQTDKGTISKKIIIN
ncbi:GEVED domain-containing protein [Yeosuana marina]|uniref:GEVED domain-containing protein n=1 Tax=Yeosuana marina TaxID=1565536 RepID=UPI0030C816ED